MVWGPNPGYPPLVPKLGIECPPVSVRRWVLAALLVVGACGHSTTVHAGRERPISMDIAITERPVSLDLAPAGATRVVPTQRASRDYRRTQQVANLLPLRDAKAFIYNHESGNNPSRHNAAGCRGLGQACPGSKLPCSDMDYACQDNWFTYAYMVPRYGTWEAARAHWISRAYRCGADWCGGSW